MKRASKFTVLLSLVALAGCAGDATAPQIVVPEARVSSVVASTAGVAVYNNIPSPLPGNVPSQGFQCCQAAEVGDHVSLAGRLLGRPPDRRGEHSATRLSRLTC